jgi:hypothetical protein
MPPIFSEQAIASPGTPLGRAAAVRQAQAGRSAGGLDMLSLFGILSVYWCYVALSNILYAYSMQAGMSEQMVFAPPLPRLLQHVFLYPLLIGGVWISLRVGWQPTWRAAPIQILLGLVFAIASRPFLILSEMIHGHLPPAWSQLKSESGAMGEFFSAVGLANWLASTLSFLLTYGFGLALVTGLSWYQRYRDSQVRYGALERSLAATRLAALRMQLSPHTLFNLLHTIRGQIAWDPATAQTMVVHLGDVLRRLLAAGERDFSRLGDEFEFVRLYLELQRSRFSDRLSVDMIDPGELSKLWIPSLILQPLVENAVVHGLAGHSGPVHIRVQAVLAQEMVKLQVINTIAAGTIVGPQGIGLRNVRERLTLHFADTAAFEASAIDDHTWVAEIQMPLVRDMRANEREVS